MRKPWPFRWKKRTEDGLTLVTAGELREMLDSGADVIVLDVRQPNAYREYPGAIPGSVRIPPADLPRRYGELPLNRLIVTYCT